MPEKTPLYEASAKAGAVFTDENGWLLPAHYGAAIAEYDSALEGTALFELSHHGKVQVKGKDAGTFLHNLCTNEVNKLPTGSGCEAFLTTGQAKIIAYVLIYRLPGDGGQDLWLDAGPGMAERVVKHLDRYLISEQLEIVDRTHEFVQLHLAGPKAEETLQRVLADWLPEARELGHRVSMHAGSAIYVRHHRPLGLPGYGLLCSREGAENLWQALLDAQARPAGLEAYRTLRIEAGTPVYGPDIDETNLPQEVGRTEQAVSFTKGCYIGQETVARIRTYGHVNRSLVGLKLTAPSAAHHGAKLFRDGKEVGQVTSSVVSPRLNTAIALAYVRRGSEAPGAVLEAVDEGVRQVAEVVALPFVGARSAAG
jgi:folate-binding protein YgfZ